MAPVRFRDRPDFRIGLELGVLVALLLRLDRTRTRFGFSVRARNRVSVGC
jgi:hypothetical protein